MTDVIQRLCFAMIAASLCLAVASAPARAASVINLCRETGAVFAFFNGVQTTKPQAEIAKQELKRIHGETSAQGDAIRYEVLYNYSNGFEDFVETFEQRLREQEGLLEGRFELFFEALQGRVMPPICTAVRSRQVKRPWPAAVWG